MKPGESAQVSFDLSPRDLSFVDRDGHRKVMVGTYGLSVGSGQPAAGQAAQTMEFSVKTEAALPL